MLGEDFGLRAIEWLLTYGVHSTVLLGGAWLLASRLRSERAREALWKIAIVGGVLTALVQTGAGIEPFGGRFRLARPPAVVTGMATAPEAAPALATAADPRSIEPRAGEAHHGADSFTFGPLAGTGSRPFPAPTSDAPPLLETYSVTDGAAPARVAWTQWVLGAWLAGGAVLCLSFIAARRRLRGRLAGRRRVEDGPLPGLLARVRRRAGLVRPVRLMVSPRLEAPVAMGTLLPQVCLPPRALTDLSPEMQESMLAHEVAHIARFDPMWLSLCRLFETVFFFQPLNRVARRRLQACSEFLCDDLAVSYTGNRIGLARCLAEVASWILGERRALPACGMADLHSPLGERVERILDADGRRNRRSRWLAPAGASLLSATALVAPSFSFVEPADERTGEDRGDLVEPVSEPEPALPFREPSHGAADPASPFAGIEALLAAFEADLGGLDAELAGIRREALELDVPARLLENLETLEREVREARARNERIRELLAIASLSAIPDPRQE